MVRRGARPLVALALAALAACTSSNPYDLGVSTVDAPLPSLAGQTLQGGAFGLQDQRGKVLVVNFWASWCGPCRDEQPALQAVWDRYRARGVQFVGVDERDDLAQARAWIDEFSVTYPSIVDQPGRFAASFAFIALPDTYVVDPTGTIRFKIFGATDEQQLSGLLDRVLAGT